MAITEEFKQELKSRTDIADVISSYVQLKRSGRNLVGLCPFHNEKSPSFSVSRENGFFYCFGCGAGGDAITFIRRIENLDYVDAVKLLAQRAGMTVPEGPSDNGMGKLKTRILEANREAARFYHRMLYTPEGRQALDYLRGRGLSEKTIIHFGLGYSPRDRFELVNHLKSKGFSGNEIIQANLANQSQKGYPFDRFSDRVMFPIIDLRGNVIGFGGRIMSDIKPKYLNTSDTPVFNKSRNLFALQFAKNKANGQLILVEGYMDVIALHQAGFENAVATLGTSLTQDQAMIIKRYCDEVVICYDADEAGQKATQRAIGILRPTGVKIKILTVPNGKDPDEFIKANGREAFLKRIESAENSFFYELRMMQREYSMEDPAQRTQFHHAVAAKLCGIEDEIERENYLKEAARRYYVDEGSLRRLVASYGRTGAAKTVWQNGAEPAREPEEKQQSRRTRPSREERIETNEKLLMTWLADEPEIFPQISPYLRPEHFHEGVFRQAAEGYWKILQEQGGGNPASVIGMFESQQEQELAASMFNTRLKGISDAREREKALKDIVISIRKAAAEKERRQIEDQTQEPSAQMLTKMLQTRKELQALQKIQFTLNSAENEQ